MKFEQISGEGIEYTIVNPAQLRAEKDDLITIQIRVKMPERPGLYHLSFGLVHGEDVSFGDVVYLNLHSKIHEEN